MEDQLLIYASFYSLILALSAHIVVEKILIRLDMGHLISLGFYRSLKDKMNASDDFFMSSLLILKYLIYLAYAGVVVTTQMLSYSQYNGVLALLGPVLAYSFLIGDRDIIVVTLWKRKRDFSNTLLFVSLILLYITTGQIKGFDSLQDKVLYISAITFAVFMWSILIFHNFFTQEAIQQRRNYKTFDHSLIISVGLFSLLPLLKFELMLTNALTKGALILFCLYLLFLFYSLLLRVTLKEYNRIENKTLFTYCLGVGIISIATTLLN